MVGMENYRFIDLFAGIGGMRIPFNMGRCVFSSEIDKFASRTYCANFNGMPYGDITKIPDSDIPAHNVLLAGFPCQSFSVIGLKKGFGDIRGTMFFEIVRILAYHQPEIFLLENVKGLKSNDKGNTFKTIMQVLTEKLGYHVEHCVLFANNFGVPQKRERVYIIGLHKRVRGKALLGPLLRNLEKSKSKTCLGDILIPAGMVDSRYTISDRAWEGLKRHRRFHEAKSQGFGYRLYTGRESHCGVLTASYNTGYHEILIEQPGRNPRKLTPRECARLQGFPEDFDLSQVSHTQIYKQLGNSVAIPVVRAIAEKMEFFI